VFKRGGNTLNTLLRSIVKLRKTILIAFGIIAMISIVLLPGTAVNYNMIDYLPQDANSTKAIRLIEREFSGGLPNLSVMVNDVSLQEALAFKEAFVAIDGVKSVLWLDDYVGKETLMSTPLAFLDANVVESAYKDRHALFSITVENGMESTVTQLVYGVLRDGDAASGSALSNAGAQESATSEVVNAMMILLPVIMIILIVATDSWLEPILFLVTIGVAILINMGTNVVFGQVSFVTQTVSPILQLAVSLDYAIFLLHSFSEYRKKHDPKDAMFYAMKSSLPTITASALTTMIGFSALIFMRFGIGADLGLNLLKGIALSYLSVMIFLPVVTLVFYKWIDKTMHRNFMPHHGGISRVLMNVRIPLLIVALMVSAPAFLGQSQVSFLYGAGVETESSRSMIDKAKIEAVFGESNALLLIVPRGQVVREKELGDALKNMPSIHTVISYAHLVGPQIPIEFVPKAVQDNFYSENYARLVLYTYLDEESVDTFNAIESIMNMASDYYDEYYLTGTSASLNDIKDVVSVDMGRINMIAVIGIFIVLMITFKSLTIPLILIFTIETAIWINLSVPYFMGTRISFIGYLILSTVQLGATVDYAILMTHKYLEERQNMPKKEAMWQATKNNVGAILVSASILAVAGFALAGTSTKPIIEELGTLLGRGTLLSFIMVVAVLPALLIAFDGLIQKTTLSHSFYLKKEGDKL
jgi:predicted RND superfamily exporter protein